MSSRAPRGAVISQRPSSMPAFFSFLLTGAVFTGAFIAMFGQALAIG